MFNRYRIFAAYIFAVPLALILGVLATSPNELTFMLVGMLLFFLALPLVIKWHHSWMIIVWNCAFVAYFLPGQPDFWLVFATMSFGLSALNYIMWRRQFLSAPEMTRSLFFLGAVVLATAFYRGGIGLKVLGGGSHGGKQYLMILGAIMGYFALTAVRVPLLKSRRLACLFFLAQTTYALSNLAYMLGPGFYFLYYLVPIGGAYAQAASDFGYTPIDRIEGLGHASIGLLCWLLTLYGLRGLFNVTKPWRLLFLLLTIWASFLAGFRSITILLFLILGFQFYFEGLLRTRLFAVVAGIAVIVSGLVLFYSNRVPLVVQRSISFLPVKLDAEVSADAAGSSEWRFAMWQVVWRDLPHYLVVGKGYGFDPDEMDLTTQAIHMGILQSFEESMLAGNYHSGPLSVIVPFGVLGSVAFLWVLIAGIRVLYFNFRYGDERLRRVNVVLLSYYLAYTISFFATFGALSYQLYVFLGTIGLSVSLNGGVRTKPRPLAEEPQFLVSRQFAIEAR